jgi:hypothetical protein
MRRRLPVLLVGATALALVAGACSGDDDAAPAADTAATTVSTAVATTTTATTRPSTSTASTGATTTTTLPKLAPLTGRPAADLATLLRPALGVKIDANIEAEPQSGLDLADVVYEEPVEGDTRYLAIFQSTDPGVVGPIRSVRPMDGDILDPLDGLFAISGGVQGFVDRANRTTRLFKEGNAAYFRERERTAPHNLMGRSAELWDQADGEHAPQPLFHYLQPSEKFGGDPAVAVDIDFIAGHRSTYTWDANTKTYQRIRDGHPHMAEDGKQITPTNLIVQFVSQRSTGSVALESVVIGEGDAMVFSDGQVLPAHWVKPDGQTPIKYLNAFGGEIGLRPGSTWVHLVPVGRDVSVASAFPAAP